MSRYRIELAVDNLDLELRRLAAIPTPGHIAFSFTREPSYLDSNQVLGPDRQTIVAIDNKTGEVVGLGTRSVRDAFVNGIPKRIGYLGALRIADHARSSRVLADGFRYLRQLHDQDPQRPDFYLTTIAEGNSSALDLLTSSRAGLPDYHFLGTFHTLALGRRNPRARIRSEVSQATLADLDAILAFLNETGSTFQFFPCYRPGDFIGKDRTFQHLDLSQIRILRRERVIVGMVAMWNQQPFRQTIVDGYRGWLAWARPFVNLWTGLVSGMKLPAPGQRLFQIHVALPLLCQNDRDLHLDLLGTIRSSLPHDVQFAVIGLAERHPLLPVARRLSIAEYRTRIYAVSWQPLPYPLTSYMERPLYLETGCL